MTPEIQPPETRTSSPAKRRNGEEIRSAILEHLRRETGHGGKGLSSRQVGVVFGIHPTTARFHLERLVGQGKLIRQEARSSTVKSPGNHTARRGRPTIVYKPVDHEQARESMIASLCMALESATAGSLSMTDSALKAGRAWGLDLARGNSCGEDEQAPANPSELPLGILEGLGFAPEPIGKGNGGYRLTACPFMDDVIHHPIICSIHLGMIQGFLAGKGRQTRVRLEPLSSPQGCLLELSEPGKTSTGPSIKLAS